MPPCSTRNHFLYTDTVGKVNPVHQWRKCTAALDSFTSLVFSQFTQGKEWENKGAQVRCVSDIILSACECVCRCFSLSHTKMIKHEIGKKIELHWCEETRNSTEQTTSDGAVCWSPSSGRRNSVDAWGVKAFGWERDCFKDGCSLKSHLERVGGGESLRLHEINASCSYSPVYQKVASSVDFNHMMPHSCSVYNSF